ncbi:cation-translocating P-type ATPase [Pontibacter burrus]|uniref:Cation-translocating P-type ATPase n=1 Tax=Pontibacter burrus TaxID=2704466 RepID=A0A6B3LQH9_9BACT|nr:cation-translocating P-type ATPase [Pontibacter burrus]NEM99049.1 cation-translocating P-type ATPase [Pontibacter burrus]
MPEAQIPEQRMHTQGLSTEQVLASRAKYGLNRLEQRRESALWVAIKRLAEEPMVVLLLAASLIYWISGDTGNSIFLAVAILMVAAISLYQDSRSRSALEKLRTFTQPTCKVIRNGRIEEIKSEEVVVGDSLMVEEGGLIAADGHIQQANDFSVDESILTGESLAVFKDQHQPDSIVYQGTTVASGLAIATVTAIGNDTRLGKIGKSIEDIAEEVTPLEIQINNFVRKMVLLGAAVLMIVWAINFSHSYSVLDSLLKSLTLAMSILPEEIPVAFTTFMALGAWRLMRLGIVVKQMKTVETLGSATVICTDKTGTITENRMQLDTVFALASHRVSRLDVNLDDNEKELIRIAMWASEPIPFDPMEVALHEAYRRQTAADERPHYRMVHEYPLGGKPPMMTHVFENSHGLRIVASKGAPEAYIKLEGLSVSEKAEVESVMHKLAGEGYRVLGVAAAAWAGDNFPGRQQELPFKFKGLVAFYDPPKHGIQQVFEAFYAAGIDVKLVTGDNAATTAAIARQVGFRGYEKSMSGEELVSIPEKELAERVMNTKVFTRMFPEAKLRIINALKAKEQVVAMTGDGVNDGPALKAAHIGIAMGRKGSEIAKQAASLILLEDDLGKMVDAVTMGRKIYANLKKAIQYIISIHIPIILTVFVPLVLGWKFPNIFSPVHIIYFELIMGPTCSIIYENEPIEKNVMEQKPRKFSQTFFNWRELTTSIVQGLVITVCSLLVYQFTVQQGYEEALTRTMVFTVLISANIFLTLVNRSFYYSVLTTLKYKNNLVPLIIGITIVLSGLLLYVEPLARFFNLVPLAGNQLLLAIVTGFVSVVWYEGVKWYKRRSRIN